MQHYSAEEVKQAWRALLSSLSPEERLAGLAPKERLAGLAPEERLAGLTPEELEHLRAWLEQQRKPG